MHSLYCCTTKLRLFTALSCLAVPSSTCVQNQCVMHDMACPTPVKYWSPMTGIMQAVREQLLAWPIHGHVLATLKSLSPLTWTNQSTQIICAIYCRQYSNTQSEFVRKHLASAMSFTTQLNLTSHEFYMHEIIHEGSKQYGQVEKGDRNILASV